MPHPKIQDDESFVRAPSCKYCRISQHTKNKLCFLVIEKKIKVNSAAKILKINESTAKLIIRQFNQLPEEQKAERIISGSIPKALKSKNEDKKSPRIRNKSKRLQKNKQGVLESKNELAQVQDQGREKIKINSQEQSQLNCKTKTNQTLSIQAQKKQMSDKSPENKCQGWFFNSIPVYLSYQVPFQFWC